MKLIRLTKLVGYSVICCGGISYAIFQISTCLMDGAGSFPVGIRILRKIPLNGPAISEPLWIVVSLYAASIPVFLYFLFLAYREYR